MTLTIVVLHWGSVNCLLHEQQAHRLPSRNPKMILLTFLYPRPLILSFGTLSRVEFTRNFPFFFFVAKSCLEMSENHFQVHMIFCLTVSQSLDSISRYSSKLEDLQKLVHVPKYIYFQYDELINFKDF